MEQLIKSYIEEHYRMNLKKEISVKIKNIESHGLHYTFDLYKDDIIYRNENVWKDDIEKWCNK